MSTVKQQVVLSESDYLEADQVSDVKHELIGGQAYAMAGANLNHDRISKTIVRKFGNHLENSPCETFGQNIKVKVGANIYYPDVLVDSGVDESQTHFATEPVIIVEVLSKSTQHIDRTTKRLSYINMPSVLEYVLIAQDYVEVEVMRKSDDWKSTHYFLGDDVPFESIGLTLAVEAIYHRVHNENMIAFLQHK